MKKQVLLLTLIYAFIFCLGINSYASPFQETTAPAQAGMKMNFQGTLFENGEPVNGDRSMTFSIDIDGTAWSETQTVQVIEGLYSVTLGAENPLPENLFYNVAERGLTVSVGSNTLGTVQLLTPFSPKEIGPANDLPRRIEIDNNKADSDTIFHFVMSADNIKNGAQRGLQIDMTGVGFKMAMRGNIASQAEDPSAKIGLIGSAIGAGSGTHYGVFGQAFGAGKTNAAVYGLAGGPGNGDEGYEDGSYNNGVLGYGQSNPWGNVGVTGFATGTVGVDNIGVSGISWVGAAGNTEIENKGLLGRAEGPGVNKAVWGRAMNGVENWAGWFEGDVAIRDGKNLQIFGPEGSIKADLNYYEPNNAGSLVLHGHNNTRRVILGSNAGGQAGFLGLYDSLDVSRAVLRAYPSGNGFFSLAGKNSTNIEAGAKFWEENSGLDLGYFKIQGSTQVDDGNGGTYFPDLVWMDAQRWEDGTELGSIEFRSTDGAHFGMNAYGLTGNRPIEIHDNDGVLKSSLKFDEDKNSGILELYGAQNDSDVKIGSFGTSAGGRFQLYRRSDDNSFTRSAIAAAAYGEGLSYFNLYSENFAADNNARLVDLYTYDRDINNNPYSDNYKRSGVDFYDNQGTRLVAVGSDKEESGTDPSGKSGFIYLSGTNSPNIELAGKRGENNDLGAIRLYGTTTDGGAWYHSNATMEVNTNGTNQWGRLSLNKTDIANSTSSENISLDANSGNITISGSLSQSSDARLKKNVSTLTSGLATVNRLRGVRYNWKDLSQPENKIGFIAQEVETVLPELVNTKADGFKTVNYAEMTAVLVEAVKELSQQIEVLKKENTSLKAELTGVKEMEDRLAKIEALLGTQNTTQKTDNQ
tara:strand:+ start:2467 stop:5055 length:2589 start_codon:yes stop_codon:yes gene_type:complete